MITDPDLYSSFKMRSRAGDRLTIDQKFAILDALYEEARLLGAFTEDDLLVGLDATVRLAAALNAHVPEAPR